MNSPFLPTRKRAALQRQPAEARRAVFLFAVTNETAIDELRTVNVEALSSDESRDLLARIKDKIV